MEEKDQLTNLPISMVHKILSRLPEEDVARTSVLSKDWAKALATFPYLSFRDTKIQCFFMKDYESKRYNFLKNVKRSLLRFRNNGLIIKQFKLTMNFFDLRYLSNDIDLWLKLASESGVEMLELFQFNNICEEHLVDYQCYMLPVEVLEAKSLTKLVLTNRIGVDLASMNPSIKFFSLQTLSLVGVYLGDENAFKLFISRCSMLEYITLKQCYSHPGGQGGLRDVRNSWIKSLSLCGLTRLKEVNVEGIQEVYVDSPCLENLHYSPSILNEDHHLHFDDCVNLRTLSLPSLRVIHSISDMWLPTLFARYTFLERLKLDNCSNLDTINVSSVQLKVFELSNCSELKAINIDAPNMLSCVYTGNPTTKWMSFLRHSSQLEVKVSTDINRLDFSNINDFIQNFRPKSVLASTSVSLNILYPMGLNPIVWQDSSAPPSIKHLEICYVPAVQTFYFSIVYRLLSSCCPTTISICGCGSFIEFLYKTLVNRNKEEYYCCSSRSECWWHGLKGVKVSSSSMKIGDNVDFITMLDSKKYSLSLENVSFTLEF